MTEQIGKDPIERLLENEKCPDGAFENYKSRCDQMLPEFRKTVTLSEELCSLEKDVENAKKLSEMLDVSEKEKKEFEEDYERILLHFEFKELEFNKRLRLFGITDKNDLQFFERQNIELAALLRVLLDSGVMTSPLQFSLSTREARVSTAYRIDRYWKKYKGIS